MKKWQLLLALVLLAAIGRQVPTPTQAAPALVLYGTFEAMGITVNLAAGDDPQQNATTLVEYRRSGSGAYQQGFPLSRVNATRFVGSLFWLEPGVSYDVRVTFTDPDGAMNGAVVSGTKSTRAEITVPAATKSYYASPDGDGTACTQAAPCDLITAINQAQAGQAVVLRGGTYYVGEITLPRSGSAGAPIVIRNAPGETAILDGSDPAPYTWADQGDGIYRAAITTESTHLVMSDSQRLYPYGSLEDLQNLIWGISGFYSNGGDVFMHLLNNAVPDPAKMVVSRYNYALYLDGTDYIDIIGLTFQHYGQGEYAKAIYLDTASYNLIKDCTFKVNDLSIGIKRPSGENVIEDNTFSDTVFDWPWDAVKAGSDLETGGIRFYAPSEGQGTIIRRNVFHDFFDGFGACPNETGGLTNETDVYENLVYRAGDDGMETDGVCSNVRIWGNTFHDVLAGVSLAPVQDGPVYAIRNLIYNTGVGNSEYSGLSFKLNSGDGDSGAIFLFHNTVDAALPGNSSFVIHEPGTWTQLTARNNIWGGSEYALYNSNPSQPLDMDYDDLYTGASPLAWWEDLGEFNTLAELRDATGQEMHGYNLPPGFNNAPGGDYTLAANSQLLDKGLIIPGVNDGYGGSAPDLGAFEFTPSLNLSGTAGNQTIHLAWKVNATLPEGTTWTITYTGPAGDEPSPIENIPANTRTYTLTGLTNYTVYAITLGTDPALFSDSIELMPTDRLVYLPAVIR